MHRRMSNWTRRQVLRLYFGESNLPTPEYIKRAAQKAMADGFTYYTENAGLPSTAARARALLREAPRRRARPRARDRGHDFRRAGAERRASGACSTPATRRWC